MAHVSPTPCAGARLDKWLWAARFYRTRALAIDAINAGHVRLNQARSKPARIVKAGDKITLRRGPTDKIVIVVAVSTQRRGAVDAQQLYRETDESIAATKLAKQRIQAESTGLSSHVRPDKKQRRTLLNIKRQQY